MEDGSARKWLVRPSGGRRKQGGWTWRLVRVLASHCLIIGWQLCVNLPPPTDFAVGQDGGKLGIQLDGGRFRAGYV